MLMIVGESVDDAFRTFADDTSGTIGTTTTNEGGTE